MTTSDKDKTAETKPQPPFPQPAKNIPAKSIKGEQTATADGEADGGHDPAHAPGHRPLDRADAAAPRGEGQDASGAAKDSEPQQSRELTRNRH